MAMKILAVIAAILFVTGSVFGANPAYQNFKGTGGITISSNPPQGDITIDGSSISASGTNVPASSSIPGRSMTNLLWSNTLFVDSTNGTNATAIRGDMSKPWRDVLVAMSNSLSGDTVWARSGVHDIGSNCLVVMPGRKLMGQGQGTIIRGWGELQWNGPVIVPGSTSEVAHLTIEHGGRNSYSGSTFGFHSGGTNFATHGPTNAYIHDVYMLGDTDCVYLRGTNYWDVTGWNVYAEAKFDSFVQFSESSNGVSRWNNCYFKVDLKGTVNPYSITAGNATAIKVQGGVAEFVSCSAIGTNGNLITRGLAAVAGLTRWIGGNIEGAGTNDVAAASRESAATFIYIGNQLRLQDIREGVTNSTTWGSEQAVLTNIVYGTDATVSRSPLGLVFNPIDPLAADPIFISPLGGLNIGALTDPGAARLQVGSLPGSGDFVAADGNGLLFSTNGVSSQSVTSIVTSFFSSSTNASGLPFTNLLWGRTLFVDSEYGNDTTARKGDVSKPWLNANVALSNAIAGDIVYLREGIHDIGVNLFHVGHGVKVTGAGSGSVLRGQGGLLTNGPVVCLTGSTSEVSHITIENSKREFYRTAAIGMFGAATNRSEGGTNMVIHDLTLIGTANNIYLRSTNSWTLRGWNLLAYSKWSCFSQFAESSNAVSRWNACYFEADLSGTTNTEAIAVGNAAAVVMEGGVAEFIACDAVATNGASSGSTPQTTALGATGGTTRWTGGSLKAAGTNDVAIVRNSLGNRLIYVGNQLRIEDAAGITWGSEQSIISNLVYTVDGLVIDDVDRLNTPIKISSQGGMSIGNVADPGAGQLSISNMTGTGSFVMADAAGKLIRTNAPAGSGGAFGADGLVQYANNGTNKAEAAFSYDEGDDTLTISNMVAVTLQIYNSVTSKSVAVNGGNVTISNAAPQVTKSSYSSTASLSGQSLDQRYRGTETSPTAIQEGDIIGSWQMLGYGDTVLRNAATLETSALGPFSDTSSAGLFVIKMGKTNSGTVKQTVFSATANDITNNANVTITSNLTVGIGSGVVNFSTNHTMEGVPTLTPSVDRTFTNAASGVMVRLPVDGITNQPVAVPLAEAQYLTVDDTGAYVAANLGDPGSSFTNIVAWETNETALTAGWTNNTSAGYNTFTTSGTTISSAIESAAFGIGSAGFPIVAGAAYRATFNLTVNSGAAPYLALATDTNAGGIQFIHTTVAGTNRIFFTSTRTGAEFVLLYVAANANYSVAAFSLVKVSPSVGGQTFYAQDGLLVNQQAVFRGGVSSRANFRTEIYGDSANARTNNEATLVGYGTDTGFENTYQAQLYGGKPTLVGYEAYGGGTSIGYKARTTNFEAIAIGPQSIAGGLADLAIGDAARAFGGNGTVIGDVMWKRGNANYLIGGGGAGTASNYIAAFCPVGGSFTYSTEIATAHNQGSFGWYDESSQTFTNGAGAFNDWWLGGPLKARGPHAITLNITHLIGTDSNGVHFTINGSAGTGAGMGGHIALKTASPGATGSVTNPLTANLTLTATNALFHKSMALLTNSVPDPTPAEGGAAYFWNSNGTVFLLTSLPFTSTWAATNKLAP